MVRNAFKPGKKRTFKRKAATPSDSPAKLRLNLFNFEQSWYTNTEDLWDEEENHATSASRRKILLPKEDIDFVTMISLTEIRVTTTMMKLTVMMKTLLKFKET